MSALSKPTTTQRRRPGRWWWGQCLGGLAILSLVLLETAGLLPWPVLERLEGQAYDIRVRQSLSGEQDPSLMLLAIDERSLQEVGQWPWPRDLVAELIETLFDDYDVAMLGLDVVFAERELWSDGEGDRQLADTLAGYPVVLGYYFEQGGGEPVGAAAIAQGIGQGRPEGLDSVGRLPAAVPVAGDTPLPVPEPERFTGNLAPLQQAAMGGGYFDNPRVDADGVFRRVPLLQRWQGEYYAALPLAIFRAMLGDPEVVPQVGEGAGVAQLEALDVGGFAIPVDGRGAALVPWYGPRGHFTTLSAVDVLERRVDPDALAGSTLILGATAPGLMDLRATPVGPVYPGAEINLSLLAGMLHQSFLAEPPWVAGAEWSLLLGLGLVMVFLYPALNAPLVALVSVLLGALIVAGNLWAWSRGLVLPIVGLLVLLLAETLWHLVMNLWREGRHKRWVASRFGEYVPPELVDDMVRQGGRFGLDGEERELTVLFSDVRGFTAFSESIPPSELTSVMNRLLSPLTRAIHEQSGTIDKYMGDAIMAFWGAPLPDEHHAEHALAGVFAMREALEEVNEAFAAEGKPRLAMGLGLNTGPMSVGNMGSSFRMAYTVMGDNVNLGARLEGLTKAYGVSIIVSETTAAQARGWAFRRLDVVQVKGRQAPLCILEPLGRDATLSDETRAWRTQWEAAVARYQQGGFEAAEVAFQALAPERDPVAALYLERLEVLCRDPPADWDGVWRHEEK